MLGKVIQHIREGYELHQNQLPFELSKKNIHTILSIFTPLAYVLHMKSKC